MSNVSVSINLSRKQQGALWLKCERLEKERDALTAENEELRRYFKPTYIEGWADGQEKGDQIARGAAIYDPLNQSERDWQQSDSKKFIEERAQ